MITATVDLEIDLYCQACGNNLSYSQRKNEHIDVELCSYCEGELIGRLAEVEEELDQYRALFG